MKRKNDMKTIKVVAAVIKIEIRYLRHREDMENSKVDGNFPVEKLKKEKLHRKL